MTKEKVSGDQIYCKELMRIRQRVLMSDKAKKQQKKDKSKKNHFI